jgi:hypothetical protein
VGPRWGRAGPHEQRGRIGGQPRRVGRDAHATREEGRASQGPSRAWAGQPGLPRAGAGELGPPCAGARRGCPAEPGERPGRRAAPAGDGGGRASAPRREEPGASHRARRAPWPGRVGPRGGAGLGRVRRGRRGLGARGRARAMATASRGRDRGRRGGQGRGGRWGSLRGGEGGAGGRRFQAAGEVEERRATRGERERTCARGGGGRGEREAVLGADWRVGPTRARRMWGARVARCGWAAKGGELGRASRPAKGRARGAGCARWAARQPGREGEGGARPRLGRGAGWAAREGGLGWAERREGDFPFLFSSYFPIIYFISNLLLSAYFIEIKQIHTKGNRCVAQHDATTKEKYFQGSPTQDVELILARTLKKTRVHLQLRLC